MGLRGTKIVKTMEDSREADGTLVLEDATEGAPIGLKRSFQLVGSCETAAANSVQRVEHLACEMSTVFQSVLFSWNKTTVKWPNRNSFEASKCSSRSNSNRHENHSNIQKNDKNNNPPMMMMQQTTHTTTTGKWSNSCKDCVGLWVVM